MRVESIDVLFVFCCRHLAHRAMKLALIVNGMCSKPCTTRAQSTRSRAVGKSQRDNILACGRWWRRVASSVSGHRIPSTRSCPVSSAPVRAPPRPLTSERSELRNGCGRLAQSRPSISANLCVSPTHPQSFALLDNIIEISKFQLDNYVSTGKWVRLNGAFQ